MTDLNWHYAQGQQTFGPITFDALRALCGRGDVTRDTLVWTDELPEWTAAGNVPGLWEPAVPYATAGSAVIGYQSLPARQIQYAGFWLRFVAMLIDAIVTSIIGTVIGGITAAATGGSHSIGGAHLFPHNAMSWEGNGLGIIAGWLYYALMESSEKQATLGKMALRLYVTDLNGQRIGFGRATGRHFGKILSNLILCIGFMMAGWTQRKQALHDMLAGTLVLRR